MELGERATTTRRRPGEPDRGRRAVRRGGATVARRTLASGWATVARLALCAAVGLALRPAGAGAGALGSQRVGTSAATFLKVGIGARAAAMGQSVVATPGDPIGLFHNPACLADLGRSTLLVERAAWLADVDITAAGVAVPIAGGVAGLSLVTLGADMDETTELDPTGTGRLFSHRDLAIGLSYARNLTDRFGFGITGRMIYEALGTEIGGPSAASWVMDMGTMFNTGFHGVALAVLIQSFGPDVTPGGGFTDARDEPVEVEYSGFAPPTNFRLGTSYDVFTARGWDLSVTAEFLKPADNDESIRVGSELSLAGDRLFLRGGYDGASDALPWSGGLGVALGSDQATAHIDYAFSVSEFFDRVDRLSFRLDF